MTKKNIFVLVALGTGLIMTGWVLANTVKLSQIPLAKAATQPVAPNLLFILDDSGSMGWEYLPEHVNLESCRARDLYTTPVSCLIGMPPFMSSAFNTLNYNPSIQYVPGVRADGSRFPSMDARATSDWTKVPEDGYRINSNTKNLVSQYPDREWCAGTDCVKNQVGYEYPNGTYQGAGTVVYTSAPYYYNLSPLYCKDDAGTDCQRTKSTNYTIQLPYRWCLSDLVTCQRNFYNPPAIDKIQPPQFIRPSFVRYGGAFFRVRFHENKCIVGEKATISSLKLGTINFLTDPVSAEIKTKKKLGDLACDNLYEEVIKHINQGTKNHNYIATKTPDGILGLTLQSIGNVTKYPTNNPIIDDEFPYGIISGSGFNYRGDAHFFERVNIVPDKIYPKLATRTDCISQENACSYVEEMTNFGNWYAYYRTRLGVMKSSASMAFSAIDDSFRVGFTQINNLSSVYLPIRPFNPEQRRNWYARLFALNPGATEPTPLRGALAFAGRVYAGKEAVDDPVQYSCQKNFALLTTDGFWNVNEGGSGVLDIKGSVITDQDTDTTRPFYQGKEIGTVPSLADVAMYYYNTDLRAPEHSNCKSPTGTDVCENNVPVTGENRNNAQHMVTFSLGLGVDGELRYQRDYKTATRGDFFNIKNGSANWPAPIQSSSSAVDDLWHAAVNGRGQYFSAQDTATLVTSLREALAGIASEYGAGASAATSTAEPVSGDNFAYIATYTTGKWVGNLEARSIDVNNGNVGQQALWCAEDIPADPVRNLVACAGKMPAKVAATSDTRVIYFNDNNQLKNFDAATLGSTRLSLFDVTKLNQYSSWSAAYKAQANATRMVNYLRGQTGFDMRDSNTFRLFREREATLGDFVGSAPRYVCKATSTFEDSGYEAFANGLKSGNNCTRTPMVYIGGNDGMLHAFDARTGEERWAFVPTPVIGQLWRLADNNYPINHRFFVDGAVTVEDVCIANCASVNATWKTILVGALGGGVANGEDTNTAAPLSGYFALDITNPAVPILLWEVTSASVGVGHHIGYALGRPWIGKVKDAKGDASWSALISSGVNPSGGGAALLVLNAYTGTVTRIISMDGGTGFTRFSPQVVKGGVDHTVTRIYGGDLAGNLWRIDPNKGGTAVKLMSSPGQPFTTEPELTLCNEKTSVFIGSGKFIENLDMDDKTQQTFYSLVDDYEKNGTLSSPRSTLQALTVKSGKISATSTSGYGLGWYLNLPDLPAVGGSERVALVDPALEGNVLTFATNVPESGICLASGKGKLYQIPIRTCGMSDMNPQVAVGTVTSLGNKLVVGMQRIKLPSGEIKLLVTGSDGTLTTSSSGQQISPPFAARRVGWRELIRD